MSLLTETKKTVIQATNVLVGPVASSGLNDRIINCVPIQPTDENNWSILTDAATGQPIDRSTVLVKYIMFEADPPLVAVEPNALIQLSASQTPTTSGPFVELIDFFFYQINEKALYEVTNSWYSTYNARNYLALRTRFGFTITSGTVLLTLVVQDIPTTL